MLSTENETSNRAEVERGNACRRPSDHWRLERLGNGGTCSDPGIGRRGRGKLGTATDGTG